MIRRSFRIGLMLGLLGGVAFALVKMLGIRPRPTAPDSTASAEPWPRLSPEPAGVVPSAPRAAPTPALADPAPAIEPDAVGEVPGPVPNPRPLVEPAPPSAARPSAVPPQQRSRKAPAAKAPAAKVSKARKAPLKASPAKNASSRAEASAPSWVEPSGGVCPTSHPVKAKLSSRIFHLPGMLNYGRTRPDRCYRDAAAAEDDGLRPAKK